MTKVFFLSTAIAAAVLFAGQTTPVEAAPLGPIQSGNGAQTSVIQEAAWQCRGRRCNWVPNYWGPVPGYARSWGPPRFPHCYWKKGLLGNWKYKCDNDWD